MQNQLKFSVYLFFIVYILYGYIEVFLGLNPTIVKIGSVAYISLNLYWCRKNIYKCIDKRLLLIFAFSMIILVLAELIVFDSLPDLNRVLIGLFVFLLFAKYRFINEDVVIINSIKIVSVLITLLALYPCIVFGHWEYYRFYILVDKPFFTLFYSICLPICFMQILQRKSLLINICLLLVIFVFNLYVIQSKLTFVSFFVFVIFYLYFYRKYYDLRLLKKYSFLFLLVMLLVIFVKPSLFILPDTFKELINNIVGGNYYHIEQNINLENTYTIRGDLRKICLNIFYENPFMGIGFGNFDNVARGYQLRLGIEGTESSVLYIMVSGGIWYLATFFFLYLSMLYRCFKKTRIEYNVQEVLLCIAILLPIFIICFANEFIDSVFWILIGYCYNVLYSKRQVAS